ncbi:MAG TPA: hypothetical protein VEG38_09710 [Acidimicrobiia bacterium]|nr:hypothetical protein [Acidimicrobiia bacterium]
MAANAGTVQGFEFDTVVGLDDASEPRQRVALSRQAIIGIGLMAVGLLALLITWVQIKDIQNIAAQIPYVASGGLLGVALSVIGAVALFSGTRTASADAVTTEDLVAQVADLRQQLKWTGDAVEQIADYLNELAGQSDFDASGRAR